MARRLSSEEAMVFDVEMDDARISAYLDEWRRRLAERQDDLAERPFAGQPWLKRSASGSFDPDL